MTTRRLGIALGIVLALLTTYAFYQKIAYALFVVFGCSICRYGVVSDFPLEVVFKFTHNGDVYEKSFLTVVHPTQGNWFETCTVYWTPARNSAPIYLNDNSVVIAHFDWSPCNKLSGAGDVVSGSGRWVWLERASSPTKAVFGWNLDPSGSGSAVGYPPFDAWRLDFTLRRAPYYQILRAEGDDRADQDPLTSWHGNILYGSPYEGNGLLFVQVRSTPAEIADSDQYEWKTLPDGCRTAFLPQYKEGRQLFPKLRWKEGRNAVKSGATWDLDSGPPTQANQPTILYPAELAKARPPVGAMIAPTTIFKDDQQLTSLGQKCTMPAWPGSATAAIVDFGRENIREIRLEGWLESSFPGKTSQMRR
jgi:hypothetical protein